MSVGDQRTGRRVGRRLEAAEQLRFRHAPLRVGQLQLVAGRGVVVAGHALPDQHVEPWVAVHRHHQRHRLADLHQSAGDRRERPFARLQHARPARRRFLS